MKIDIEKINVESGEFKNFPILRFEDGEKFKWSFGYTKAKVIMKYIVVIEEFVKRYEATHDGC